MRALGVILVAAAVGVLHRNATVSPWVDDRELASEPAWFQLAAPHWHATVAGSASLASAVVRGVDPLTDASSGGDSRAVAAFAAALGAAAMLLLLLRLAVPFAIAAMLCLSLTGLVLPVSGPMTAAHGLQTLFAALLLLVAGLPPHLSFLRIVLLASVTVAGAVNHGAFLAFAVVIWTVVAMTASGRARAMWLAAGTVAMIAALALVGWSLHRGAPHEPRAVGMPTAPDLARALVGGRLSGVHQPKAVQAMREVISRSIPGPALLGGVLIAIGAGWRLRRRSATALVLGTACVLLFVTRTWLPDPAVGLIPAQLSLLVLAGLGLTRVTQQAVRGSAAIALVAAAFIGLSGFVTVNVARAAAADAEVDAYVDSLGPTLRATPWTADGLTTARALLERADTAVARSRIAMTADLLQGVPEDMPLPAVVSAGARRITDGVWVVPQEVPYRSAAAFVDAQLDQRWLAIALHGALAPGFCADLLARLNVPAALAASGRLSVLAPLGESPTPTLSGPDVSVSYGDPLPGYDEQIPARFEIGSLSQAGIRINGEDTGAIAEGMALAIFDETRIQTTGHIIGDCRQPLPPPISDRRLKAGFVIEGADMNIDRESLLPIVAGEPVSVPMGQEGDAWFSAGWHASEGRGSGIVRWTASHEARVTVLLSQTQSVRMTLAAQLAVSGAGADGLHLTWNGTTIRPERPFAGDGEWVIPASLTRRGQNTLTLHVAELVSPAALSGSSDTRLLGVAVSRLMFEPLVARR